MPETQPSPGGIILPLIQPIIHTVGVIMAVLKPKIRR